MGRPIKEKNFGSYVTGNALRVSAYLSGTLYTDCYIKKQRGHKKYKVTSVTSGLTGDCFLVSTAPSAKSQMQLVGYTSLTGHPWNQAVVISKLTQHRAYDYNGNEYKWVLTSDSTEDFLFLTKINPNTY